MFRQSLVVLFFVFYPITAVNTQLWPYAIYEIARHEFDQPGILLLLTSIPSTTKYHLKVEEDIDAENNLLQLINNNWSITISNHNYSPPSEDIGLFKVKRTKQVVMIINEDLLLDTEKFAHELKAWKYNPAWSGQSKFLVIIRCKYFDKGLSANLLLNALWFFAKVSHVVALEVKQGIINAYTWIPYSPTCRVEIVHLGQWEILAPLQYIFNDKSYWNLNKCYIFAACAEYEPYVYNNENGSFTQGFEIMIFQTLSKMLNFTIGYLVINNQSQFLTFDDEKPAGLIGFLYTHQTDLAFSGMPLNLEGYQLADVIDSYYADDYVWAAPLREKVKSWRNFFIVFQFSMWCGIFIVFGIVSWVIKELCAIKFSMASMIVCAMTTNTAIKYPSSGFILRLFLASFFIYVINVTSAYQSALIGMLTSGLTEQSAESFNEAVNDGFFVNIFPHMIEEVESAYPTIYKKLIARKQINWTTNYLDVLRKISRKERQIVMLPDTIIRYEISQRFTSANGKKYIRWLKKRYGPYQSVFFMPKDHPLQYTIQSAVRRLVESGCVQYFVRVASNLLKQNDENCEVNEMDDYDEEVVSSLSFEQTIGAFIIFLSMTFVAIISFLFELFIYFLGVNKHVLFKWIFKYSCK